MDYAIYKTSSNGGEPRIIHRFTQEACNHQAKRAARKKLDDMWRRVLQRTGLFRNYRGTKDSFEYDYVAGTRATERIRFYIAPLKD